MNIAFITSSAEAGKDGMADYTLSLAAALKTLGHSPLVIGFNDRWLPGATESVRGESAEGVALERIPSSLPDAERVERACARLKDFRPEWVSFQMSCYAYHPKGLLFGLARHLPRLSACCENWQVMFQELWIAFQTGSLAKHRLVGALQRIAIGRAVRALRPKLLETSTPLFQALLRTIGLKASILPLAGSIPVSTDPGLDWFLQVIGLPGLPVSTKKRREHLVGGFFGAIYPNWEPEPFFSSLRNVTAKTGQKVTILAAGRMGGGGEAIWDKLAPSYPDFRFRKLGELSTVNVSQYLQNLDFGIAATPWQAIGKSSAAAAMLDHGLPVMVTRNDSQPRQRLQLAAPADPLLILANGDVSDRFFAGLPRRAPRHTTLDLAAEFVRRMEAARSAVRLG